MTSKPTFSVQMTTALRERLAERAAAEDRSAGWIVVKAIEAYLSDTKKGAIGVAPNTHV